MAAAPAMVAAYVATAAATAYTAYSAHQSNKAAAQQSQNDANTKIAQGRIEAERIRKQVAAQRSAAQAAAAENGLDVNEGTPVVIDQTISKEGEEDAWLTQLGGVSAAQRLRVDAGNYNKAATSALVGGALNLAASGASMYSGWQGAKK